MAGVEGVFRRLGDVLSIRNGSGCAEKWTSVSPWFQRAAPYRSVGVVNLGQNVFVILAGGSLRTTRVY